MRVEQIGQGPLLIALHGLGGSGRYWRDLSRNAPGYTIVAPDLGGFGESSKPDASYDLTFHLASLEALVDHVAPTGKLTLVGHSVGGVLAAAWAAKHPQRVSALILVAAPFPGVHRLPSALHWVRAKPNALSRRIPVAAARILIYTLAFPIALLRGYGSSDLRDYTRQSLAARTRTAGSLMADPTTANRLASLHDLPRTVRALLATGTTDRLVGTADTDRWTALLPRADLLSCNAGHQLLRQGGVATIGEWLTQLPRTH